MHLEQHIDGVVQDCSNSIPNALELLQSCTEPSTYYSKTASNALILSFANTSVHIQEKYHPNSPHR